MLGIQRRMSCILQVTGVVRLVQEPAVARDCSYDEEGRDPQN
jgi:hypothetical protein